MTFEIHNEKVNDFFVIDGEAIEDIKAKTSIEQAKRNWNDEDCWSREITQIRG